ncbi:MAG: c-type cytochrome [Sulfuriferula sp.]|nr:c-type cytochrome [Sulfuriferula sp.]
MKTAFTLIATAFLTLSANVYADNAGLSLAQKNACMSCHGVDKKIVGPGYTDVAAKYRAELAGVKKPADKKAAELAIENKLVDKVKKGGAGAWGTIPMPPNPQVADADLHTIVKWVLSLK